MSTKYGEAVVRGPRGGSGGRSEKKFVGGGTEGRGAGGFVEDFRICQSALVELVEKVGGVGEALVWKLCPNCGKLSAGRIHPAAKPQAQQICACACAANRIDSTPHMA